MTTGKTIALTRRTFVSKVMSLCFLICYVGHSFSAKEQASFNFMAAVTICSDSGAQKIKPATVCTVSPSICHEVVGPDAMILELLLQKGSWPRVSVFTRARVKSGRELLPSSGFPRNYISDYNTSTTAPHPTPRPPQFMQGFPEDFQDRPQAGQNRRKICLGARGSKISDTIINVITSVL